MSPANGGFRIGLLGRGTVGGAFAELLPAHADRIALATGLRPSICGVLTRSTGSFEEILAEADLIVELIGGIDPAREFVLSAMQSGKHVVTANKQLLSQYGEELWEAARANGVQLRFEGAVAGVVPVIRVVQESLSGATINRIHGIVNGTTNFILTEMARTGMTFDEALADAQRLGYAEADPSEDVDGRDAAAKMAILARLAFDTPVHLDQVRYEGIEQIQPDDLEYARELGLGLKLIGTAERIAGGLSVRVHPAFLYPGHPLASVGGPFNAVTVESPEITEITMSGPGAGGPADGERRARGRHQRDDPAGLDAADDAAAGDHSGRRLRVLPSPRGRGRAGGSRQRRPGARAPPGVGQVGRPEGPRPAGAPGDGRPPGARVPVHGGDGRHRQARGHAPAAAGDPGAGGGVRIGSPPQCVLSRS